MDFTKNSALSNRSKILELIRQNDDIYKAQISRITGLSIPTIMRITDKFIEDGLIAVTGRDSSTGGKPPEMLRIVGSSKYFAGVDLSDNSVTCVLIDFEEEKISENNIFIDVENLDGDGIVQVTIDMLERTLDNLNIDRSKLYGIGVGVPGIADSATGIVYSQNLSLVGYDMRIKFESKFCVPVFVDNTAKVRALAELRKGSAKDSDSFIMIALGNGIGSAVISDREIYRGCNNMSGELGHTIMDVHGELCSCGKRGCLEVFSSTKAIEQKIKKIIGNGFYSSALDLVGGNVEDIKAEMVVLAARKNDRIAKLVVDEALSYLCAAIENIVGLFDINHIVMSGRIIRNSPWLLERLRKTLKDRHKLCTREDEIIISAATLGNESAALGAACLPFIHFVENVE